MNEILCSFALLLSLAPGDWPQWGHDWSRNMTSDETGLPIDFAPGEFVGATDEIDPATTRKVKWIAKLGSQSYGNPTVANGRVYVGTNNDVPRNKKFQGDRCTVYCLSEKDGSFIWELNVPKLGTGKVSDWEYLGICSSPAVEGNRVYVCTNRCEVVCLDVEGMANGNDGPFTDEGQYMAGPGKPPLEVEKTDADILWVFDMIKECGVFPHNITSGSILVVGDRLWVTTSNGVDYGHVETPAPHAPALIVLDKTTGALVAEEASGISTRIFHGDWSSPAYLKHDETEMAIFGAPDGYCYGFAPEPEVDAEGFGILKELWRCDANKPEYRVKDGKPMKYATRNGPSEVMGTPVVYEGRVYAAIGQDPEHGEGLGHMICIDPSGSGDVTKSKILWTYDKIRRSMSTPAIRDGLVYITDYSGFVYCLEAKTGKEQWVHDTKGHIWGSPLVVDGKVYVGNEDGYLTILPATAKYDPKAVIEIEMTSPVLSTPIAANGVLYIATHTHLFAFQETKE